MPTLGTAQISVPNWLPLPEMFEEITVGGIARWQWLDLGLLLVLSVVAGHLARYLIAVVFKWRYQLWEKKITPDAAKGVKRGLVWLAATGVWWLAVPELQLPDRFGHDVYTILQIFTIGAFIWL